MKKILFLLTVLVSISAFSFAATLTFDWAKDDFNQTGLKGVNCMTYDPVGQVIVLSNYGNDDLSLEKYNKDNGDLVGSQALTVPVGHPVSATMGFAVGAAANGNIYITDDGGDTPPAGWHNSLFKAASSSVATITNVNSVVATIDFTFARNLSVVGSGANTYIAGTGSGDSGPISIWKSNDAGTTAFSPWKEITGSALTPVGAAKAGVGISPIVGSDPPQWAAGCDVVGAINRCRIFKYNAGIGEYDWMSDATDAEYICFDADFDVTDGYFPMVAVFTKDGTGSGGAPPKVELFKLNTATGTLSSLAIWTGPTIALTEGTRGSLAIDTANRKIYIAYRTVTGSTVVTMARFSYTRDPLPTPTPTPLGVTEPWGLYE